MLPYRYFLGAGATKANDTVNAKSMEPILA